MDGVMPVVVVVGINPVPAAIVRFDRVVRPTNTSISPCDNNVLPRESKSPYLGRVRISDPWFDRLRALEVRRRLNRRAGLRKMIFDLRITFDPCHIRTRCQRLSD